MLLCYLINIMKTTSSLKYLAIHSQTNFDEECCVLLESMASYTRQVEKLYLFSSKSKQEAKQSASFGRIASAIIAQNDCLTEIHLKLAEIPVEFTDALQRSPSLAKIASLYLW